MSEQKICTLYGERAYWRTYRGDQDPWEEQKGSLLRGYASLNERIQEIIQHDHIVVRSISYNCIQLPEQPNGYIPVEFVASILYSGTVQRGRFDQPDHPNQTLMHVYL